MACLLLDGLTLAKRINIRLSEDIRRLNEKTGQVPGLAYLVTEDDPASQHYVAGKTRACKEVGIVSFVETISSHSSQKELTEKIERLNHRADVHGILVQLPIPSCFNLGALLEKINPEKDVDALHPCNRGLLFSQNPPVLPCTPKGIVRLLQENGILLEGKKAVILGRSLVVGRPLVMLFLNENATVTVCHTKTRDLKFHTRQAEVLVAAAGRPGFITKEHVSPGAVVVDVGINNVHGKLVGDVDFEGVSQVASAITPVPGGVGPMTVAMLLENTFLAFRKKLGLKKDF